MRAARELEEPEEDEGFERIERIAFERSERPGSLECSSPRPALDAYRRASSDAPHLVFDWRPGRAGAARARTEHAVCTHPGGPPVCWCRPPLPGLLLELRAPPRHRAARSFVVGVSAAHRTLARTLGATFVEA